MSLSEKLVVAAKKGNSRDVKRLLGRGASFTQDQYGNTALHEAAWNGNKDIVKSLLGAFCFVDGINHTGFTPLHLASQNGHAKVAKVLLKWRADPCLLNQHGETALHLIAKYNHPSVITAFSAFKIPMDIRGKDGNTALHIAAKLGNIEVMRALLHHGADPLLTNVQGIRALGFADAGNYKDCVKLLRSILMKSNPKQSSTLPTSVIPRCSTYSSSSSEAMAAKVRMMKAMGVSKKKQYGRSSKENKKHKRGGYYSEDEVSYYLRDSSPPPLPCSRFSISQEVPNGYPNRAMGAVNHSFAHLCRSSSSASSQPNNSASIDQLLNEIEMESRGSGDSGTPSEEVMEEGRGLIEPYAEIHHLHSPHSTEFGCSHSSSCHICALPTDAKSSLLSSQEGRISRESYDILQPPVPRYCSTSSPKPNSVLPPSPHHHHGIGNSDRHVHATLKEPHLRDGRERTKLNKCQSSPGKSPSRSPGKSPSKSSHKLASRSPHKLILRSPGREQRKSEKQSSEDMDTYVYMAPLIKVSSRREEEVESDSTCLQNESGRFSPSSCEGGSKNSKKAIICNHEIDTLTRHEPDSSLTPAKGILSQSSVNELDKTLLEQYLHEELETMRQAFQIRLGQMEKRYRKQLVVEQQKNVTQHHVLDQQEPKRDQTSYLNARRRHNPHTGNHASGKRRNSWHSYISSEQELEKLALPDDPRSESSLGIDSDHYTTDESDIEMEQPMLPTADLSAEKGKVEQSNDKNKKCDSSAFKAYLEEFPKSMRQEVNQCPVGPVYAQPTKHKEGLKRGDKSWKEGKETKENMPQLPPMNKEDLSKDDDTAKMVQLKVEEYRQKMQNFQDRSEPKIYSVGEKYRRQLDEVKRYNCRVSDNPSNMTNGMKGLENVDTRTLV